MQHHIEKIQEIIQQCGEPLEGNCFYLDGTLDTDPRLIPKQTNLINISRNKKRICEIGFNAGHSMLLFLYDNPTIEKVTIFDIASHKYTKPCYEYIKNIFKNVDFEFIEGDTIMTLPGFCNDIHDRFDMIHIDGGHNKVVVKSDFTCATYLSDLIIADDSNHSPIRNEIESLLKEEWKEDKNINETTLYSHRILYR